MHLLENKAVIGPPDVQLRFYMGFYFIGTLTVENLLGIAASTPETEPAFIFVSESSWIHGQSIDLDRIDHIQTSIDQILQKRFNSSASMQLYLYMWGQFFHSGPHDLMEGFIVGAIHFRIDHGSLIATQIITKKDDVNVISYG